MQKTVATGTIRLNVDRNDTGRDLHELLDIAARANPKRGFLIVSTLIGRHLPTTPAVMRSVMRGLAIRIPADLPGPVLFLGMAETAVGLGQGVHDAWRNCTGRVDAHFIQSSRQTCPEMDLWATFEEGHSHATSHLVHMPVNVDTIKSCRSLVVVDDECSTGTTFLTVEEAMIPLLPRLERVIDVVITEWSRDEARHRVSLVSGTMDWSPNGELGEVPGSSPNAHGKTSPGAAPGRQGYDRHPGLPNVTVPEFEEGARIAVIADGENAYDALLIAELLERNGAITTIQSITRSPAHVGGAMATRAILSDAHGSGASCYAYNLEVSRPEKIVLVVEIEGAQAEEMARQTSVGRENIHMIKVTR